jgi:hypothetical protein
MGHSLSRVAGRSALVLAFTLAAWPVQAADCMPEFRAGGPDADAYGARRNYPVGTIVQRAEQRFIVGSSVSFDKLRPGPTVTAPPNPSPLSRRCEPFVLRYTHDGREHSLDDYLARHPVTGLLIAKGGTILVERYQCMVAATPSASSRNRWPRRSPPCCSASP